MDRVICTLVFFTIVAAVSGDCDRNTGPSGTTKCVKFPSYDTSQWATCLTDAYIKVKSSRRHLCSDRTRTYCWYQCMCELNDECSGPNVYRNCSCDPDETTTVSVSVASPVPTLPPWCFSPDGEECSWYPECLEKRHPCEGTSAAYAITYSLKFCDLYTEHYQSFSQDGKLWIDAVRKCLQVELVPILRPWVSVTCGEIKQMAFASHTKCYASPVSGVSYCSLGLRDRLRIFWTIKGAFTSAFLESVKGLFDLTYACGIEQIKDIRDRVSNYMNRIKIFVKESVSAKTKQTLVDVIAERQGWAGKGLDWFWLDHHNRDKRTALLSNTSLNEINIVLASRRQYDLNAPDSPVVNVTAIVTELADSLENGFPSLHVDGVQVDIQSMDACGEFTCNSTYLEVAANIVDPTIVDPNNNGYLVGVSICSIGLVGLTTIGLLFMP